MYSYWLCVSFSFSSPFPSLFRNNTSLQSSQDTSAVAAFRFPTTFTGTNSFISNIGGGITLLNTRMQASGNMMFDSNRAVFGGGIAMDDRCLVRMYVIHCCFSLVVLCVCVYMYV